MKKTVKNPIKTVVESREVLYPAIEVQKGFGETPIAVDICKALLGWSTTPLPERPDEPCLFKDLEGNDIWCHNNVNADYTNRPLIMSNVLALKQEHLRRRWRPNGETIIIGRTGLILNGQHQMIALCLAAQEWEKYPEDWDTWTSEPTMEKLVVFGISEDDETVNTMDTCKPRTLAEVIFRSELFKAMKNVDRKLCAKICEHAVRLLWHRTGVENDAFAPRRTHAEALDFIARHPSLLRCVKHIYGEDGDKNISKIMSAGYSAAIMYLMATSNTVPETYHHSDLAHESLCDLSNYDKAAEFFELIGAGSSDTIILKNTIVELRQVGRDSRDARLATILKGWTLFHQGESLTEERLKLDWKMDGDSFKLMECPTAGGIDLGNPKDDISGDDEPSEEEQAEHRAEAKAIRQANSRKRGGKASAIPEVGDTVWVREDEGAWDGELLEIYDASGKLAGRIRSNGTGKEFHSPMDRVSLREPD